MSSKEQLSRLGGVEQLRVDALSNLDFEEKQFASEGGESLGAMPEAKAKAKRESSPTVKEDIPVLITSKLSRGAPSYTSSGCWL
jgi:hypothetical protein